MKSLRSKQQMKIYESADLGLDSLMTVEVFWLDFIVSHDKGPVVLTLWVSVGPFGESDKNWDLWVNTF